MTWRKTTVSRGRDVLPLRAPPPLWGAPEGERFARALAVPVGGLAIPRHTRLLGPSPPSRRVDGDHGDCGDADRPDLFR
jgi:hypothetical protein